MGAGLPRHHAGAEDGLTRTHASMKPLVTIWRWLRSLGQTRAVKQEIDEELRLHLEMRTAENIAAGMSSEEAARTARRRFGNVQSIREECREARGASFGETTLQDIRFGLWMLLKNRGFTAVAVLTVAHACCPAATASSTPINCSVLSLLSQSGRATGGFYLGLTA